MPLPVVVAVAGMADCDDESQPPALLTQELIAPIPPPPPLPPPENLPELDLDPNLFPNQQDASRTSNRTSTNEAIIANASPTCGAGGVGWDQFFWMQDKVQRRRCASIEALISTVTGKTPRNSK